METENVMGILAICISVLACIGIGAYAYFDQPESIDLSGVYENRISISTLISNINEVEKAIEDIDCDISQSDLNDLEDDLEKYARDKAGEDGEDGDTGDIGPAGIPGINGTDGSVGLTGATGLPGADGVDGINGTSCSVNQSGTIEGYPEGCAIISCTDGTSVTICEVGEQGEKGDTGPQGLPGSDANCLEVEGLLNEILGCYLIVNEGNPDYTILDCLRGLELIA